MEFPLSNLPVLIVGAGPTGLMMACALARQGITFRLIDKKSKRTLASNATWIQTRTIELLDQLGILDRFIKMGHSCDAINLYAEGKQLSQLSLKNIDSIYSFVLMLPQSKIEHILETYLKELNHTVERSIELIDIKCNHEIAISTLRHSDGHTEILTSDWVIACDGANSIIREKCGFHFLGEDLTEQFIVADATIDFSYMPKNQIYFFFNPGTILAAFPLGEKKYRLAANLHLDVPRKLFTEREVIEIVQERAHGKYYVTDVAWISLFWIHSKTVEQMRKGPIFLAGDAAHIHSPAGGQGMNTGIQDAYNLAWKLALVIKGKAKPVLLDSYQIERYPVIKKVVDQNTYFTKLALFDENFIPKLQKFSQDLSNGNQIEIEKKFGNQLSQLDIQYQDSPIISYESKLLPSGQRAPDVTVDHATLYRYLSDTQHHVLLFTGLNPTEKTVENIKFLQKSLENLYPDLIKSHVIHKEKINGFSHMILDPDEIIHEAYHIKNPAIYIVRPDTYIAYSSEDLNIESIEKFLRIYFY